MGLVRLKIRELAAEKGWTLKEVSDRSGVIYSTVRSYARRPEMAMVDFTCLRFWKSRAIDHWCQLNVKPSQISTTRSGLLWQSPFFSPFRNLPGFEIETA
jgi:putative transcriptional regulator